MIKHGLEGIDIYNPIKNKLPQIIEYFVKFYGEEYRERITQRLNDTIYIFTDRLSEEQTFIIENYFLDKKQELLKTFLLDIKEKTKVSLDFSVKNIDKSMSTLEKIKDIIDENMLTKAHKLLKHFKFEKLNIDSQEELEICLKDEKSSKELYKTLNEIFSVYKNTYKEDFDYLERENRRFQKLYNQNNINMKKLYNDFKIKCEDKIVTKLGQSLHILPTEENLDKLEMYLPMIVDYLEIKDYNNIPQFSSAIFHHIFYEIARMTSQSVNIGNSMEAKVNYVKDKIENLSNEVSLYRDENLFNILKARPELAKQLNSLSKKYVFGMDLASSVQDFINATASTMGGFAFSTVPINEPERCTGICVCPSYFLLNDETLVHEMNHIVLGSASFKDDIFFGKSGLHYFKRQVDTDGDSHSLQNNMSITTFNEIVNELMAFLITNQMKEDDFHFSYNNNDKVVFYRFCFPMLERFIMNNMKTLIKCCMEEGPVDYDKYFGEGNIKELSKITKDCLDPVVKQDGLKSILTDLKKHIDDQVYFHDLVYIDDPNWSNATKKYIDCFKRADKVIEKIEAYQAKQEKVESEMEDA